MEDLLPYYERELAFLRQHSRQFAERYPKLAAHEPRLRQVRVELELHRKTVNALYFSINAVLVVRPAQEPVSFDALLTPTSLQYSVSRQRRPGA